jgi:hypothetical protein
VILGAELDTNEPATTSHWGRTSSDFLLNPFETSVFVTEAKA